MKPRLVGSILAATVAAAAGTATAATPQGGGANNVVIARATTDGQASVRTHTQISQVGSDGVESSNIAAAASTTCTGCRSEAVAVQVVFATGSPSYFTPANVASASNGGCNRCSAFAFAWQYVVQTDGAVMLPADARRQVDLIEREIDDAAASIAPDSLADAQALNARLGELTAELKTVIDTQAQLAGMHAVGEVHRHVEIAPAD